MNFEVSFFRNTHFLSNKKFNKNKNMYILYVFVTL